MLDGQLAHLSEDGGGYLGEFGGKLHGEGKILLIPPPYGEGLVKTGRSKA